MVFCHLENAIFHFLKKHYNIGAYFPYSFIKIHFYNETTGNIRKALASLKKYKIIKSIGKGEYKFIKDEFQYPSDSKYVKTIDLQNNKIDNGFIDLIIQTIKKLIYEDDVYPSMENIYLYLKTNNSKEKVFKHIEYMIDNFIVIKDEHGKIIPYHIYKQNLNLLEKEDKKNNLPRNTKNIILDYLYGYFVNFGSYPEYNKLIKHIQKVIEVRPDDINYYLTDLIIKNIIKLENNCIVPVKLKTDQSEKEKSTGTNIEKEILEYINYHNHKYIIEKKLDKLKKESKKSPEIDINTEIRKIYGYITKKNKELKIEIEQDIEKSLYSVGKEIGEFHGKPFAKLMIEINDINQRINYQNQQKDEKIRSLNDKIKTLRKNVNTLIQETKNLKCLKKTLPNS
jgi:hypothetical protein